MSLTIELPPRLEEQLRETAALEGRNPSELAFAFVLAGLTEARTRQREKNRAAIALLDEWLAMERTDDGDREWEEFKEGIEATRRDMGQRSLFGE
jgi:hypothetical protein